MNSFAYHYKENHGFMRKLAAFICIYLFFSAVRAQPVYLLEKNSGLPLLGKYTCIYEDKGCNLKINDIVRLENSAFKSSADEVPNFNITKSAIWLKFRITARDEADWRVESSNSSMNHIDFYSVRKGIVVSEQLSGIDLSDNERQILAGHILYKTDLKPGDTLDCYIRVETPGPMATPVRAGDLQEFFECDHRLNLLHGLYFGIMLLMVLYNLFLFSTNHSLVYVYYIFYVIFSALFIAFFVGYTHMMPSFMRMLFVRMPVIVPALFGLFGMLFTTKFLNTKELAPGFHKCIVFFMYLVSIPVFLSVFGWPHESVMVIQLFGVILAVLSLGAGITALRKGYRAAKFYVIGFGAYMTGLLILIISSTSHTSFFGMELYALEFGSAIEAIMLSFAIGDKLNMANLEKTEAQTKMLETLQENERLIREQNAMLERKVKERTLELQEQKELVEEQNKDILDSIRYAKRIQDSLLPSEKYLERHLSKKAAGQ
jgi:hypothetical protein